MVRDPVLPGPRGRRHPEQALGVRLVLAEQHLRLALGHDLEAAEERVLGREAACALEPKLRPCLPVEPPGPGVPVPGGREDVQRVGLGAGVGDAHREQEVVGVALGVVRLDDPVAVVVECPGVEQLVLGVELAPPPVLRDEIGVRELALRVVVAPPVPRVARQGVEIPPVLLGILAVVALVPGQPEDALLEDRIAAVPEREPEAEPLLDVREPGEAVLAPAVGARAGVVVWEVLPGRAVRAVILADRAPLALAQVRPPQIPVARLAQPVFEPTERRDALPLGAHERMLTRIDLDLFPR